MSLRESAVKDFWLKLFSLALAVLIWVTVKFVLQNQPNPGASLSPSEAGETVPNPARE